MIVTTASETETSAVGRDLARTLEPGAVVLLAGDLGAGKTAFVRGMAEGLSIDPGEVSSPTFALIQEYRGGRLTLHHVDLYRLQPHEVDDLGLEEVIASGGVTAIEWPDRLPHVWSRAVRVSIRHGEGNVREIEVAADRPELYSDR